MGFLGKLAGLGAAAGAAFAAVKIAQRYSENKKAAQGEYIKPIREESIGDVLDDVKKAAVDVYSETSEKVKTSVKKAADGAGIDTQQVSEKMGAAGKVVTDAGNKVIDKFQEEAPKVVEKAKATAETVATKAKKTVKKTADKAKDVAEEVVD